MDNAKALLATLQQQYDKRIQELTLHRDMIGRVYFVDGEECRYCFKLYRPQHSAQAKQAVNIMVYLKEKGYPVAPIIPTHEGANHITVETEEGDAVGVLYRFLAGDDPDISTTLESVGDQVGRLHTMMEGYPHQLIHRDQGFYVERYLSILEQLDYTTKRVDEMKTAGQSLWQAVCACEDGFCHGDLHTGNMRLIDGRYVLFDFDAAANAHPIIDIATLCDGSHFNHFGDDAVQRTLKKLEEFKRGYERHRGIADGDVKGVLAFIALRHYEIIATISEAKGVECLSRAFLDEQYGWIINYAKLFANHH